MFSDEGPHETSTPKKVPKKNQTKETSTLCAISLI